MPRLDGLPSKTKEAHITTTCNNATYATYEKNVRGFLATQFGLSVHPYADAKIIVDFLGGRAPYHCAQAIARNNGFTPR